MQINTPLQTYISEITQALKAGNATEHTHRPALKKLIESLEKGITATNEPKWIDCGAPDFIITKRNIPLGYIETKKIGEPLDEWEKSDQLQRYRDGLPNLVLTDYLEFRWYVLGEHRLTASLVGAGFQPARSKGKLNLDPEGEKQVVEYLTNFLTHEVPTIMSPKDLAQRMASLAKLIRNSIQLTFKQEIDKGTLHDQFDGFHKVLLHNLTPDIFADMYAQTICYGLFAAKCNAQPGQPFTRKDAAYDLPKTNPFLRKMFDHIAGVDLDEHILWIVEDLIHLLNRANIDEILADFGKRTRREDPVVHFYETFLAAYDPKMRESRGVYYTPEPVVSYIVRSVDHILKTDFSLKDGLADSSKIKMKNPDGKSTKDIHKVLILDPATGTGTFLHGVVDHIYDHILAKGQKGAWKSYVSQDLLPRLFGFELLMAPYAVVHMKLGLQLAEMKYDFKSDERLRVYLTNTLEESESIGETTFGQWIADEANAARDVKNDVPVMVVIGNPPYSGQSANASQRIVLDPEGKKGKIRKEITWIGKLIKDYFQVDGHKLDEKNPKWLHDDYVKFIRFAQWRIEQTGHGILAFITNHGYLDNPTFPGMRQSLMNTFDDIYILDLHGNVDKKEKCPDGSKDENVFNNIGEGVAIGIFVKKPVGVGLKPTSTVKHAHLWGLRETKYRWLLQDDIKSTKWSVLKPQSYNYFFIPQDIRLLPEYQKGLKITDIMKTYSVGIATARDSLTIHWSKDDILKTIKDFASLPEEEARIKYNLGKDARDWKILFAQKDLKDSNLSKENVVPIYYRPFDIRYTYYTGHSRGFHCMPRPDVMHHILNRDNLVLITSRLTKGETFAHAQVTQIISEVICMSPKTSNNGFVFPLYLYPDTSKKDLFDEFSGKREPNLSKEFIKDFSQRLKMTFIPDEKGDRKKTFGPEDVFNYIFAILYSPTYRKRYTEFLKGGFPRLPLTSNQDLFRKLCDLGNELVELHLMEKQGDSITSYPISDEHLVENVRYTEPGQGAKKGRVWINKTQYFEGIPPEIWNFHIGGYQVCQKWLKDRKGRQLSSDDIKHYQEIVSALSETIRLMAEIDKVINSHGGFPIK
jgi:predicted helicase